MAAAARRYTVQIIPMWKDNFSYLLRCTRSGACALVDPAEHRAVRSFLQQHAVDRRAIRAILTTHGHSDHAPDPSLLSWLEEAEEEQAASAGEDGTPVPKLRVFSRDRVAGTTDPLDVDGAEIAVGDLRVRAWFTPCHTAGSVCYVVQDKDEPAVFTGDTLFNFGCGRFNSGTAQQMHAALSRLATLPENTLVYSGHEYTVDNLKFAQTIDPENEDVKEELESAQLKRKCGDPTVPTTMQQELKANPFMRWSSKSIRRQLQLGDEASDAEVVGAIRERKNNFRV